MFPPMDPTVRAVFSSRRVLFIAFNMAIPHHGRVYVAAREGLFYIHSLLLRIACRDLEQSRIEDPSFDLGDLLGIQHPALILGR
jgi:hypothetical protein